MEHGFDIEVAKRYGIHEAILLKNLYFWVKKNIANANNYYDGYYWTFNTAEAWANLFPYMNARQVTYALQKLIDNGLVVKGNYNKNKNDRTLWYALTEKGFAELGEEFPILQNCQMDLTKLSNGFNKIVKALPYNKQDIKQDISISDLQASREKTINATTTETTTEYTAVDNIGELQDNKQLNNSPYKSNSNKLNTVNNCIVEEQVIYNKKTKTMTDEQVKYFEIIWKLYPRKNNKVKAKETFAKKIGRDAVKSREIALQIWDLLKRSLVVWGKERDGEGRQIEYIPYFTTWLNQNFENIK